MVQRGKELHERRINGAGRGKWATVGQPGAGATRLIVPSKIGTRPGAKR